MMTRLAKEARQKRNEEQKFEKKGGGGALQGKSSPQNWDEDPFANYDL